MSDEIFSGGMVDAAQFSGEVYDAACVHNSRLLNQANNMRNAAMARAQVQKINYCLDAEPTQWCRNGELHRNHYIHSDDCDCSLKKAPKFLGTFTSTADAKAAAEAQYDDAMYCPACIRDVYTPESEEFLLMYYARSKGRSIQRYVLSPYIRDAHCIHVEGCPHCNAGARKLGYFTHLDFLAQYVVEQGLAKSDKLTPCPFCMPEDSSEYYNLRGRIEHMYMERRSGAQVLHMYNCPHRTSSWQDLGFSHDGKTTFAALTAAFSQGDALVCPVCLGTELARRSVTPVTEQLIARLAENGMFDRSRL